MIFNAALFHSIQLCLPIEPEIQAEAWQQSRRFATPAAQWNAYLNQLSLQTLLPCLREDAPQANIAPSATAAAQIWELVNGTAIVWDKRLVLVPTETIDLDEIRIPQEWVDIPSWAADYYLAVQVNPDELWVRVAGFISHSQLKQQAPLDLNDRMYCLDESDLIPDLSVLWLSQKLAVLHAPENALENAPEITRAALPALSSLSAGEAAHLIERLGNPALLHPRLAVPFERWGALLAHGGWRQRLSERRQGLPERCSPRQWLAAGLTAFGEAARSWSLVEYQFGAAARSSETAAPTAALARQVTIAQQRYELQLIPIDLATNCWRFELSSLTLAPIPAGVTLRLLSEDLQPFEGNEDRAVAAVERLYVEVRLEAGEALVWQVEPLPADYDQELLRF